jgi:hypothetical protein
MTIVKEKVKLSLYLIKHHTIKMYGEWRYSSTFLDVGNRRKLVVSFTPLAALSPSGTHWIAGLADPRACLEAVEKSLLLPRGKESRPSSS